MTTETVDGVEVTTHLGWFWNPFERQWECTTQSSERRTVILIASSYDLDNPPWFSPWGVAS